jgi:hypothetical protein
MHAMRERERKRLQCFPMAEPLTDSDSCCVVRVITIRAWNRTWLEWNRTCEHYESHSSSFCGGCMSSFFFYRNSQGDLVIQLMRELDAYVCTMLHKFPNAYVQCQQVPICLSVVWWAYVRVGYFLGGLLYAYQNTVQYPLLLPPSCSCKPKPILLNAKKI